MRRSSKPAFRAAASCALPMSAAKRLRCSLPIRNQCNLPGTDYQSDCLSASVHCAALDMKTSCADCRLALSNASTYGSMHKQPLEIGQIKSRS